MVVGLLEEDQEKDLPQEDGVVLQQLGLLLQLNHNLQVVVGVLHKPKLVVQLAGAQISKTEALAGVKTLKHRQQAGAHQSKPRPLAGAQRIRARPAGVTASLAVVVDGVIAHPTTTVEAGVTVLRTVVAGAATTTNRAEEDGVVPAAVVAGVRKIAATVVAGVILVTTTKGGVGNKKRISLINYLDFIFLATNVVRLVFRQKDLKIGEEKLITNMEVRMS